MQRNLNNRVESLFPIEDPILRQVIRERVLQTNLADTVNAHELLSDGTYVRVQPEPGEPLFDSQSWFITHRLIEPSQEGNGTATSAFPSGS